MKSTIARRIMGVIAAVGLLAYLAGFLFGKTYVELDMKDYY